MRIKKHRDSRRASKKLKELLRDRPFGVSSNRDWDDPSIAYSHWDGASTDDDDDDDGYEDESEWYEDVNTDPRTSQDFN